MSETGCTCPVAGYCARHNREKPEHLHRLCQTDQRYFDLWDNPPHRGVKAAAQEQIDRLELLRELWRELHAYNPAEWSADKAQTWFKAWLRRVPSFGCACREHFRRILKKLPPDFSSRDAFYAWSVAAHNEVNKSLGKPIWEAREQK